MSRWGSSRLDSNSLSCLLEGEAVRNRNLEGLLRGVILAWEAVSS